jgi:DNA-binding NtrC family response regulator
MPSVREQETGGSGNSTRIILVVEDEILIRLITAEHFRDAGFQVREASNAAEAKLLLESAGPVALVFSDVNMPGGEDGVALAHGIAQRYPTIPIVLTSALLPPLRDPRWRFLLKPYTLEAAEMLVRSLLRDAATGS